MKVLSTQRKLYPVNRPKCAFYRDLTGTRLNTMGGGGLDTNSRDTNSFLYHVILCRDVQIKKRAEEHFASCFINVPTYHGRI